MYKLRSLAWVKQFFLFFVIITFSLCLNACSKDDELSDPTRASILVSHNINGRALGDNERSVLYYCYNEHGLRTFGPAKLAKASQILLQAVPVESTSISMTYYDGDGKVVGFYSQPVQLKIGEIYEINDPAWEDIDSITNLKGIEIVQEDGTRVHTGDNINFIAVARFLDAQGNSYLQAFSYLCEWNSSNEAIITNKDSEGNVSSNANTFTSVEAGKAKVSLSFYGFSDDVEVVVTDAVVESVELETESVILPVTLKGFNNSLMATWSDGVVTDVSVDSSWTSGNTESVMAYLGMIVPISVINSEVEDKSVNVIATYNCGGEGFTDTCSVTVVDGTLKDLDIELESDVAFVGGEDLDVYVYGVYAMNGREERFMINDTRLYTVTVSDTDVAAVELDDYFEYKISGLSQGTTTVTATYNEDHSFRASAELTVLDNREDSEESVEESIEESAEEPVEESIEESAEEPVEESTEESAEESGEDSTEESAEEFAE